MPDGDDDVEIIDYDNANGVKVEEKIKILKDKDELTEEEKTAQLAEKKRIQALKRKRDAKEMSERAKLKKQLGRNLTQGER